MTKKNVSFRLALASTALMAASSAHALLVAGWDFSQINGTPYATVGDIAFENWAEVDTLWANYSDLYQIHENPAYWGITSPDGPHNGMLYMDGQFGSDVVVDLSVPEVTVLNTEIASTGSLDLNNEGTMVFQGFNGDFVASAFAAVGQLARTDTKFACTQTWAGKNVVFSADLGTQLVASGWQLVYAGRVAQPDAGGPGADAVWEYSLTGASDSYTAAGSHHITTEEQLFTLDLSNIEELNGSSKLYLRCRFTGVSAGLGEFPSIDNVCINAASVTEPGGSDAGFFEGTPDEVYADVYRSDWFGWYFHPAGSAWYYHYEGLEWVYIWEESTPDSVYFYSFTPNYTGWMWTRSDYYPWCYVWGSTNDWIYTHSGM